MASGTTTWRTSCQPSQAEAAGRLDDPPVHVAHAVGGVEVHGEQRGQGDEEHLGRLADAEPDDEQEDDGGVGDHPEHLQRRSRGAPRRDGYRPTMMPRMRPMPGAEGEAERRRGERRCRCRPSRSWWRSRSTKASHVAAGVDSVVGVDDAGAGEDPPGGEDRRRARGGGAPASRAGAARPVADAGPDQPGQRRCPTSRRGGADAGDAVVAVASGEAS